MGLNDLVSENKVESGVIDAGPEDIVLDAYDWKYHLAHDPGFGYIIAQNNKGTDVPALIVKWYDELLEEGHSAMKMHEDMKEEIANEKETIEEKFL